MTDMKAAAERLAKEINGRLTGQAIVHGFEAGEESQVMASLILPVLQAAYAAGQEAPDGWQLVPKKPTYEMEVAPDCEDCATPDEAVRIYKVMLAAAPQPLKEYTP